MISFDSTHKQILSPSCVNCRDPYFQPADDTLLKVGCCSYSPVFTLFELNACIAHGEESFFREKIFANKHAMIRDFEVIVYAAVNEAFYKRNLSTFSKIEIDDVRLSYSVCQFFEDGIGCQLPPSFKNATCRSFICMTVEQCLTDIEQKALYQAAKNIQNEVKTFNDCYIKVFQEQRWNFHHHLDEIIAYFQNNF